MSEKSRAEYFRERRKNFKAFCVTVERKKLEQFEKHLENVGKTRASWLNEKIDEELGK